MNIFKTENLSLDAILSDFNRSIDQLADFTSRTVESADTERKIALECTERATELQAQAERAERVRFKLLEIME